MSFDWLGRRRLARTTHLRAARETKSRVNISVSKRIVVDGLILLVSAWYILKQLLSSVSLKAVDIYLAGHLKNIPHYPPSLRQTTVNNDYDIIIIIIIIIVGIINMLSSSL